MTRSAVLERAATLGLAVIVLAAALTVRLHEINQPLVTFRAIRHYRSAIIARDFYYHATSGISPKAMAVADANRNVQQAGEPPLMEWLACASYLAIGGENTAIPRTYAAIAWVMGAIPLFFLALRVGTRRGALIACSLYLFLPYAIIASRNFQPDAVMTLASLCALLALLRHYERPAPARRSLAIALVGLAMLIKPMSIFLTVPALIGLHVARTGVRGRALPPPMVSLALSAVPAGIYYGYSALFGNFVRDQMHMRFVPHLLLTRFFYSGLLTQVERVHTLPVFLIGLIGVLFAPRGPGRVLLVCLWIGYACFAVAFTYHMPTHDYYHWPFIALVSLGVGAVWSRLETAAANRVPVRMVVALTATVCVLIAVAGSMTAWPRLHVPNADKTLAMYREIGQLTDHDTRVLFLDPEYGYPLMYHAEVSGDTWPGQDDLAAEALGGAAPQTAADRFASDYAGMGAHYFVVTDLDSLDAQPDLQSLLADRTTLIHRGHGYHVYKFNTFNATR